MSTNFGSAGIPGTRLKVCVWWVVVVVVVGGGWWITYPVPYNTSPILGAGALMLNAWTGLLQLQTIKRCVEVHIGGLMKPLV